MTTRFGAALLGLAVSVSLSAIAAPTASASAAADPWGPQHVLFKGKVGLQVRQATTSNGISIVVFQAHPRTPESQYRVSVQVPGQPWTSSIPVSDGKVANPTVVAWGPGHASVLWQTKAGVNNWLFHLRTMGPDGGWGDPEELITSKFAYPGFQAAMNNHGEVALAWVNGDNTDRVAIRDSQDSWARPPAVPVVHPTFDGTPFIGNPLDLFLDDNGQVTDVTWGTLGDSHRAIWLMRLSDDDTWASERVAPLAGGHLGYNWVDESNYAANPQGDIGLVYSQQDPQSKHWSTYFRYRPATGHLGGARLLSHLRCDYLSNSCADVAVADDGGALMAYGVGTADGDVLVRFLRRSATGGFGKPQTVSEPLWSAPYQGVRLAANGRGDGLVSFVGGTKKVLYSQFARCLGQVVACGPALRRANDPSWLDPWVATVGPAGRGTVTWVSSSPRGLASRHLAALPG